VGTHGNFIRYFLIAITALPMLGWRQVKTAAATLEIVLPKPGATARARREIEILYVGHSLAIRNLYRKDLLIDIFCPGQVFGPNVDREKHAWRMGLLYSVWNSRFSELILQMMDPIHASRPQFFERGYIILYYHRFRNFAGLVFKLV
jgi:hypothetical protein